MGAFTDLTEQRFNKLTVTGRAENKGKHPRWYCDCDCGNKTIVHAGSLKSGGTKSCGCILRKNFIDLTGQRFGKLTVVKCGEKQGVQWRWHCACDCGNETVVVGNALKTGNTKSCGCLIGNLEFTDLTGQRFGKLKVVAGGATERKGAGLWQCVCDCGNETTVNGYRLRSDLVRSCGCLAALPPGEAAINFAFSSHRKTNAEARGYKSTLTRDQFAAICSQNCTYCGQPPSMVSRSKRSNGDFLRSGIDRKDNSKGYTPENSVPCCKECNIVKSDLTMEAWQSYILHVAMAAIRRHHKQNGV
ncbi:hypothetical protein KIP88_02840 [Bradyrhizobium sp. SRL28]|uniref:hypothetical protein n=1 Tax=Bradyrhizobium sp. SRL28 TaxID=2836178 RepID=UPI001BDE32AC|nr:hypothetical protein [Bradyrhizobium sp. SRL28]MBT1509428.1 hypothetical protein [Bradyrhizobium sp. SRL28]